MFSRLDPGRRERLARAPASVRFRAATPARSVPLQRVLVRTYGCQMNVHDTEKVENLLLHHGWTLARDLDDADLFILNTCSIRE